MRHVDKKTFPLVGCGTSCQAFTLIELLTVVAIVAILASLVIPAVSGMIDSSHKAVCTSNLRNVGTALNLYIADNDGYLPAGVNRVVRGQLAYPPAPNSQRDLVYFLGPYLNMKQVAGAAQFPDMICPAHKKMGVIWHRTYAVRSPVMVVMGSANLWADPPAVGFPVKVMSESVVNSKQYGWLTDNDRFSYGSAFPYDPVHSGGRNWLFLDGRVEFSKKWLGPPPTPPGA